MKTRTELIKETIELELTLMIYKKGLHLAKRVIDVNIADPDLNDEMIEAHIEYKDYIRKNKLTDL